VQILTLGVSVYRQLASIRKDVDSGGDFCDPSAKGFDIIIDRVGTTKNDTEYYVRPDNKRTALGNMDWYENQYDLSVYCKVKTIAEIRSMMAGEDSAEEEEEEDKRPRRDDDQHRPVQRSRRTAQDDISQDEEDAELEEDDVKY
jgi:hypothetical protein